MVELFDDTRGALRFDGRRLAYVSTQARSGRGSRRWSEIEIFARESGGYIVYEVGRSTIDGEVDRRRIREADDARAAYDAIAGSRRFTASDTEAFAAASAADPNFAASLGDVHEVETLAPLGPGVSAILEDIALREFLLERDGDRALRFRGVQLAGTSSRVDGAPAWMEVAIYRTIDGRYITQKAQYKAAELVSPARTAVNVVDDAPAALKALTRAGSAWLESCVLDAMHDAAATDPLFERSLGNLLQGNNFRSLLADNRQLTSAERATLDAMARGAQIVASTPDGAPPQLLRWDGVTSTRLPHPRVFIALSRDRLIRKERANVTDGEPAKWSITDRGRAALAAEPPTP